jgi:hypothetical protein
VSMLSLAQQRGLILVLAAFVVFVIVRLRGC